MLDRQQTLANLVLDHSECAEVLQRHRIDFCCHGDVSIEAAAKARGLDVDALAEELSRTIAQREDTASSADPRELTTSELVAHIVSKHHSYLKKTLPFLRALSQKVSRVHGDHNPKLRDLEVAVEELASSLIVHLDEEETTLFPALTAATRDEADVALQLGAMLEEHHEVAKLLEHVRAASDGFALPDWACNSYRTLFAELFRLESDTFVHVHLENHVLRPRFTKRGVA